MKSGGNLFGIHIYGTWGGSFGFYFGGWCKYLEIIWANSRSLGISPFLEMDALSPVFLSFLYLFLFFLFLSVYQWDTYVFV